MQNIIIKGINDIFYANAFLIHIFFIKNINI